MNREYISNRWHIAKYARLWAMERYRSLCGCDYSSLPKEMKKALTTIATSVLLGSLAHSADFLQNLSHQPPAGFEKARRPISNPTLFDLALPTSNLHPIYVHHNLPSAVSAAAGGTIPLGGDLDVYALQFEIALSDRLSIVASKDGYIDINDTTLNGAGYDNGFANLGAGVKYAFILDPQSGTAMSGTATLELPTGNSDVFQGEGDGSINLIVYGLKLMDEWQFAGAIGAQVPFSDDQAANIFVSAHASYEVHPCFIPLVELNWFHVLDSGNGSLFPGVSNGINFEGSDFFNLGGVGAGDNRDMVTVAVGFRSRITETVQAGIAYELPLTNEENTLWDNRFTLDVVWTF